MKRAPIEAVYRWYFDPQPMQPLVIARIVFGLCIFSAHVVRIPYVENLYGPSGLVGPALYHGLRPPIGYLDPIIGGWLASFVPEPGSGLTVFLFGALLVASLCFAVGFWTRLSGLVTLALFAYFVRLRIPFAYWGWAIFMMPLLLYVIAAPTGRFLSVDAWLARRRSGEGPRPLSEWRAPGWPLRLMQIHLCTMYFVAGWSRIDEAGWLQGQVVFNAVNHTLFSRLTIDWQPWKPLLSIGNWVAFVLEPVAPLLLWLPRIGVWWAYLLIAMHVGLELVTNIGMWSYLMVVLLTSFLPTAHLDAALRLLPGVSEVRTNR